LSDLPLPPKPQSQYLDTQEVAIARTIQNLNAHGSDRGKILEMTSTIDASDVPRLALMLSMAQDQDLELSWLWAYCYSELALSKSVPAKRGGICSEQMVEVSKAPQLMQPEGLMSRINPFKRR